MVVGYRFYPTIFEIFTYFLIGKNFGTEEIIKEENIYAYDPDFLPAELRKDPLEDVFFAYCQPGRISNGMISRTTPTGFWKSTGQDMKYSVENRTIGFKKTLVYRVNKARSEKTPPSGWTMTEYRLNEHLGLGDWVLCRIKFKPAECPEAVSHLKRKRSSSKEETSSAAPVVTRKGKQKVSKASELQGNGALFPTKAQENLCSGASTSHGRFDGMQTEENLWAPGAVTSLGILDTMQTQENFWTSGASMSCGGLGSLTHGNLWGPGASVCHGGSDSMIVDIPFCTPQFKDLTLPAFDESRNLSLSDCAFQVPETENHDGGNLAQQYVAGTSRSSCSYGMCSDLSQDFLSSIFNVDLSTHATDGSQIVNRNAGQETDAADDESFDLHGFFWGSDVKRCNFTPSNSHTGIYFDSDVDSDTDDISPNENFEESTSSSTDPGSPLVEKNAGTRQSEPKIQSGLLFIASLKEVERSVTKKLGEHPSSYLRRIKVVEARALFRMRYLLAFASVVSVLFVSRLMV